MADSMRRNVLERAEAWFGRAQNLYGLLLAIFGSGVSAAFGITGDFSPYLVLSLATGTLVFTTIAYSIAKNTKWRVGLVLGVFGISAASTLYALHAQHIEEERKYNGYLLTFADFGLDVLQVPSAPNRPRKIQSMQLQVTFDNPNSFPIYVKSIRRTVTINGRGSGDEQEVVEQKVPDLARDFRITDSAVEFRPPIEMAQDELPGTIDFTVCYGREKGKYTKSYNMKGKLIFPRWGVDGLPHKPRFIPADLDDHTYGYTNDCPS